MRGIKRSGRYATAPKAIFSAVACENTGAKTCPSAHSLKAYSVPCPTVLVSACAKTLFGAIATRPLQRCSLVVDPPGIVQRTATQP